MREDAAAAGRPRSTLQLQAQAAERSLSLSTEREREISSQRCSRIAGKAKGQNAREFDE